MADPRPVGDTTEQLDPVLAKRARASELANLGKRLGYSVILIAIAEIYSQCARAIVRSRLWASGDESADLPTVGDILAEMTQGRIDGAAYDADWPKRARTSLW